MPDLYVKKRIPIECVQQSEDFTVETPEGQMSGKSGDWLARGVKGEFCAIRKDIFEETYERYIEPDPPAPSWIEERAPGRIFDEAEVRRRLEAIKSRRKAVPNGPWAVVPQPWDREGMTVVGRPAKKWEQGAGDPHISPFIVTTDNALFRAEETDEDTERDRAVALFIAHSWADLRFFEELVERFLAAKEASVA